MSAFRLRVSTGTRTPIYRQIVDQVRLAVATGTLSAGDPLPSVRALAQELVVNPNTVAKAYAELTREGLVNAQPGRGVFVAARRPIFDPVERQRRLGEALDALVAEAVALGFTPEEIREAVARRVAALRPARDAAGEDSEAARETASKGPTKEEPTS
jgi:GntR family transcriptional regulator